MKLKGIYFLTFWMLLSFSQVQEKEEISSVTEVTFDYDHFIIQKGAIGPLKIGMTIKEADEHLKGLKKINSEAEHFGFGGGSPAYLYYDKNEFVLSLIPALNSDTLLFIIAGSPKLTTTNNLNPKCTTGKIAQSYPNTIIQLDLMNNWESISDTTNNWEFIFMTEDDKRIGKYHTIYTPSTIKDSTVTSNWITIK
jgi:hypothetical protein